MTTYIRNAQGQLVRMFLDSETSNGDVPILDLPRMAYNQNDTTIEKPELDANGNEILALPVMKCDPPKAIKRVHEGIELLDLPSMKFDLQQ